MHKKLIVRLAGGLGNQLFSYSAARHLAKLNEAELVIDNQSGFSKDATYKRFCQLDHFNSPCRKASEHERLHPFPRVRKKLLKWINSKKPFCRRNYIYQEQIDYDPRLLNVRFTGRAFIEGYWQSESYFKNIEETIRHDLQIHPPSDPTNQKLSKKIREQESIAIHVRFFDSPDQQEYQNNIQAEYYKKACHTMDEKFPDAHYFLFSDRPSEALSLIPIEPERVTCVSHNEGDENAYADIWLMSLCKHFIIANSTFSWWGAWLSDCSKKIVIAPGQEIREGVAWWGFDGLLPADWIRL